jgi:HEAT repeat protein
VGVIAVGGFMYWRFMQRFNALNACKADHLVEDNFTPEFAPCVREVLKTSTFEDVRVDAIALLTMVEDEESIPILVDKLGDGGETMRQAAQAIARLDGDEAQKAREPLSRAMEGAGPRDKVIIAWALARLGDERAFRPLLDGYIDGYTKELAGWDDEFLIDYAASDPKALDELIKLVDSDDPSHRWFAARTMGKIRDPRVVDPLLRLLDDQNRNVVKEAAISLGASGDDRAGESILKVLNQYPDMTDDLLRSIQQSVGAPGLKAIYDKVDSPSRKNKIVNLIREIRDPRAGDLLMAIMDDVEAETKDKGPTAGVKTKKEITLALSDLGDERAIPMIKYFIYLDDLNAACKIYDCGPVNVDALSEEQAENYVRGYRLSPVIRDMIDGLVNINTPEARQIVLDLWAQITDSNKKYGGDAYLYWQARPALVMSALGRMGGESIGSMLMEQVCSNAQVNMRAKALNVGASKDITEPCPDIGAASRALGRLKYEPVLEKLIEIGVRPEDIDFSVPSVDNESFLMDRRAVLQGMAYLGSPAAFETIATIIEDPLDDFRTREDAVYPLAYCIDETNREAILEKVTSSATDLPVRILYANALKFQSDPGTAQRLVPLLNEATPNALLVPVAKVIGESCDPEAISQLVDIVLSNEAQSVDALADHQNAALFAISLCGEPKHLNAVLPFFRSQNAEDIVRYHYQEFPFYLTTEGFDSGRVFKKLRTALWLRQHDIVWAWQYLTGRLEVGFEDNPDGLSLLEIRTRLMDKVRNGVPWEQEVSAWALLGMKDRGYLLALSAEGGVQAKVARDVLREADRG